MTCEILYEATGTNANDLERTEPDETTLVHIKSILHSHIPSCCDDPFYRAMLNSVRSNSIRICRESASVGQMRSIIQCIKQVPQLQAQLVTVELDNIFLSEDMFYEVCQSTRCCTALTNISLCGHGVKDERAGLHLMVMTAKQLRRISLNWNKLGLCANSFTQFIDALSEHRNLEQLDMSNNLISSELIQAVGHALVGNRSRCSNFKRLNLEWNHIGNHGATALIDELRNNRHLVHLEMRGNPVDYPVMTRLNQLVVSNQNYQQEIRMRQVEEERLRSERQSLEEQVSNLADQCAAAHSMRAVQEAQYFTVQANLEAVTENLHQSETQLRVARQRNEEQTQHYDYLLQSHREETDRLQILLEAQTKFVSITLDERMQHWDAFRNHTKQILSVNEEKQQKINSLEIQIQQMVRGVDASLTSKVEAWKDLNQCTEQVSELHKEVVFLKCTCESKELEICRIRSELERMTGIAEGHETRIRCVVDAMEDLKNDRQRGLDDVKRMHDLCAAREKAFCDDRIRERESITEIYEIQIKSLTDQVSQRDDLLRDLERELGHTRQTHRETLRKMEEAKKNEHEQFLRLQLEVQRVKNTLLQNESEKSMAENRLELFERMREDLYAQMMEIQRESMDRIQTFSKVFAVEKRSFEEGLMRKDIQVKEYEQKWLSAVRDIAKLREEREILVSGVEMSVVKAVRGALEAEITT